MVSKGEVARVVVADDQPTFREAACEVIADTPGLSLVAVTGRASTLPELIPQSAAAVLLLDVRMPGEDTLAIALGLRCAHPELRIVLVSADSVLDIPEHVFDAGIGFLPKELLTPESLTAAITAREAGPETGW
ncbi:MAG: response regulator [Dermatophilus congolensis]|nr:response regulator [Dermatophilus congolensis]